MLDVLIMKANDTPSPLVSNCLASVGYAKLYAKYPVNVIDHEGVMGHLGESMAKGLELCSSPYVCWVDDDDYLMPHAFTAIENALYREPIGICAREINLYSNGHMAATNARHHLTVYRTSWVKKFDLSPFKALPRVYLMNRLPGDTIDVLSWIYVRRIRLSGGMKLLGKYLQAETPLCQ